jgi:hypothetical protein
MQNIADGGHNIALGDQSLKNLKGNAGAETYKGSYNVGLGSDTLLSIKRSSNNTAIGASAGSAITDGETEGSILCDNNILIGAFQIGTATDTNTTRIGTQVWNGSAFVNTTNQCYIGGIYNATEPSANYRHLVYATDSHQLGANSEAKTVGTNGNLSVGYDSTQGFTKPTGKIANGANIGYIKIINNRNTGTLEAPTWVENTGYAPAVPLASANTPRILYGIIDATGAKTSGSAGWTPSKIATGDFRIDFTNNTFTQAPAATFTGWWNGAPTAVYIYAIDKDHLKYSPVLIPTGALTDTIVYFTAIGV